MIPLEWSELPSLHSTSSSAQENKAKRPLNTDQVFHELVSQRLSQGFQIICFSEDQRLMRQQQQLIQQQQQQHPPNYKDLHSQAS